jgi:hypothetical protein
MSCLQLQRMSFTDWNYSIIHVSKALKMRMKMRLISTHEEVQNLLKIPSQQEHITFETSM